VNQEHAKRRNFGAFYLILEQRGHFLGAFCRIIGDKDTTPGADFVDRQLPDRLVVAVVDAYRSVLTDDLDHGDRLTRASHFAKFDDGVVCICVA
jgi:hypothetical protein